VLHYRSYLFSGDHLAWDRDARTLTAHRDVCWYDWPTQLRSVARLTDWEITWIFPGHGERVQLAAPAMRAALRALAAGAAQPRTTRKS
jgi:glyoxylase-like metal-dependent hydrolase (beta-lactamase superfamily II)